MTEPKVTTEYHAHLTLPNQTICDLVGQDNEDVQNDIRNLLGGQKVTFKEADTYTMWVFHREIQKPIGHINKITVPEELSVQTVAEHRLELLQKTERQAV